MNLTYGYNATAGQMGSGSTAGNAGQLMSISGTIGGLTESADYSYDNLGRLLASNQTSNGSSAERRFAYDRWGNRTAMWDAVSGGNQIQSLTLEQSGGVPTNRIQFNLPPGTNVALASNGATATASSSYSGGGSYPASSVINGDRKGVNWGSGGVWNDDTANTYPDWVQVSFNGSKSINEIDVFTLQDNYGNPSEPTEAMTFSQYGIVDFKVQYWDGVGWTAVSGGVVTGNNKVWRKFTFSSLTTDKIRVRATNALNSYSRVTEIEAYQVATPAYDAAGNVTNDGVHTYEYDSENRIVSVDGGATASSAYDNQNRRYKNAIGSTVTHYVWKGSHVLAEHNGSTGAVLIDYVYSGSRMIAKVASGSIQYFLSDRLSVRLSLDSGGNVLGRQSHLPFGEDFGESGTQEKHHLASYERDSESGTDYAVNRQHVAGVGRFMTVDPEAGRLAAPQRLNRYAYARNNPTFYSDPDGRDLMVIGSHLFLVSCNAPVANIGAWDDPDLEFSDTTEECDLTDLGSIGAIPSGRGGEKTECDPNFIKADTQLFTDKNGKTFSAADINYAARVVYAEGTGRNQGGTDDELYAIASALYNRLQNPSYRDADGAMHMSFYSVANQGGQFQAVTGRERFRKKFEGSDTEGGHYKNLSEGDCLDLYYAMSAVLRVLKDGAGYDFTEFRGGRHGPGTRIGGSRFGYSGTF